MILGGEIPLREIWEGFFYLPYKEYNIMNKSDVVDFHTAVGINPESQIAYAGKIKQTEHVSIIDSHGNVHEKDVEIYISWDSIVQILNLVRERAGIIK